jgi:hypothetical protein
MAWAIAKRPRFRLITQMIVIALIACGLKMGPEWWTAAQRYWREKPMRDAWNGPISIRVTRQDSLETVLKGIKKATVRSRLATGLPVYVDPVGLQEAGVNLTSKVTADIDGKDLTAGEFLNHVLRPMGMAAKLEDGVVKLDSKVSLDVPLGR